MSLALTHFLIGAICSMVLLILINFYNENILRYRVEFIFLGGLFALVPDINKVVFLFSEQYGDIVTYSFHETAVSNLFFFHGILDNDIFRSLLIETLAFCVILFCIFLILFSYLTQKRF